ncbi:hypothetical protein V8E36_005405 [Tilletia maclaganii]
MADLYTTFSLPPPPPPIWLSFYRGQDRARLPNFLEDSDPAAAARKWMYDQIMFICIPSLWTQVKIVTALAAAIIVCAGLVIVRRMMQRSLWILRLKQTERGPLIVPNAVMVFAGTEGLFAIIFLTFINLVHNSWVIKKEPLPNLILWITQTWSPLIAGPIWSAFGVWHARPPSSKPSYAAHRGSQSHHFLGVPLPKPLFVSVACLLIPVMQMLTLLGPSIRGNDAREEATKLWAEWKVDYGNATTLSRDMVLEMQRILNTDLRAWYWLSISMFVWFGWCVLLFFVYAGVTLRLILPLQAQLQELNERNKKEQLAMANISVVSRTLGPFDAPTTNNQTESISLPLETPRLRNLAVNYVGGRMDQIDFQKPEQDGVNEHWNLRLADLKEDAINNSFFPPVRPSAKYLRAAYVHFMFQGIMISIAIAYFTGVTLFLALQSYTMSERHRMGEVIDLAFLLAMWGCTRFGLGVFVSITFRTYEPVLVSLLQGGGGGGTGAATAAGGGGGGGGSNGGAPRGTGKSPRFSSSKSPTLWLGSPRLESPRLDSRLQSDKSFSDA